MSVLLIPSVLCIPSALNSEILPTLGAKPRSSKAEILDLPDISSVSITDLKVNTEENASIFLNELSPHFNVEVTKYGGRGCFASSTIPKGTVVLQCSKPISSTLIKGFRKEVCNTCFKYNDGANMKTKLSIKGSIHSLFFCSEACKLTFVQNDTDSLYLKWLLDIEKYYVAGLKTPEQEPKEPKTSDLKLLVDKEWTEVKKWELQKLKKSKWISQIPAINDMEYTEVKYIAGVIFQMHKHSNKPNAELTFFDLLHSTEAEKVAKYPYLLYSYINIFKFVKCSAPDAVQHLISSDLIRSILGKNLSNAFGIWSETTNPTEDREYFGFAVYPSASYFNHSCGPNLKKSREENRIIFKTLNEINVGEELCIDYGNYLHEPVEKRREELQEWFFECGCVRCADEMALKST